MRKFIMSVTTVASLSLAAIPVLGLTQAANAAEPAARIAYGDLNLADPAQAAIFKARVETAATKLCRAKMDSSEGLAVPVRTCVVDGLRQAEHQLPKAQRQAFAYAAAAHTVSVAAK